MPRTLIASPAMTTVSPSKTLSKSVCLPSSETPQAELANASAAMIAPLNIVMLQRISIGVEIGVTPSSKPNVASFSKQLLFVSYLQQFLYPPKVKSEFPPSSDA